MQHIFITRPSVVSPRWQQAFPQLQILTDAAQLPHQLGDSLLWVLLGDDDFAQHIPRWVAAGGRVIALTQQEDPRQAKRMLELGANGYLHYLAVVPVLEQASQVVQVGGLWLGADLMRQLVFATAGILNLATSESPVLSLLSQRERDVAEAVAAGKNNKEVARDLNITERTVKAHLSAVFDKLKVRDRLHLVLVMAGK